MTYEGKYDIIGNTYKSSTNVVPNTWSMRYQRNATNCPDGDPNLGAIHQSDNISMGNSYSLTAGDWSNWQSPTRVITNSLITPISSKDMEGILLPDVGASLNRDAVDIRIVSDYVNLNGGPISSETAVGGYPTLASGTAYTDTDDDGMSDTWEIEGGLNPNDNSDGKKDRNSDGYTNLEVFLHHLPHSSRPFLGGL